MTIEITDENTEILNKYIQIEKNYQDIAENLIEGNLKLKNDLDVIQIDNLPDWDYEHKYSSNTYQLYLHTLNFIKSLVLAYKKYRDLIYISLANDIINSWIKENLIQEIKSNYAWYDHTVANRVQNLLFFQANVPAEYKLNNSLFSEVFDTHINFLKKYQNYPENNHGIMMDKALIMSSLFVKDEEKKNENLLLAKNRIEKAILRDYSYMSTHLENSPDYHRIVTNWLSDITKILDDVKMPLSTKYKIKLQNAVRYSGVVSNYKNEYPMIGDTSQGISKVKKEDIDYVDFEAGVGVFNDKFTFSTMVFNCGFQSLTHKHYDDLSFTLSLNKEQIFIDSGKYNYSKKDPIRQHIISPEAHTTLYVQNKTYPLSKEKNIKIVSSFSGNDYKIIKGIHEGYENISLERIIVFIEEGIYIIIDKIKSEEQHTFVQNFVLHDKVKLSNMDKRKYLLITESQKEYILQEHSKIATSKIFKGQNSNALISKKFNIVEDTTRLEIRKKQKNSSFLTTISPINDQVERATVSNNVLYVSVNGKEKWINLI